MLALKAWEKPFADVLRGPKQGTAEAQLELQMLWPSVLRMQESPDIALIALAGIALPVHERTMLYISHLGAGSNLNVSSRGTSKTTTICVLYSTVRGLLFSKRKAVTLSATGFRGAQIIFNDFKRWAEGGWSSQEEGLEFLRASTKSQDIIHRGQNMWSIDYKSHSTNKALPTNDPDKIRGNRANDLYLDESNFMDEPLVETVAMSFLNVVDDFRHGGADAQKNSVFFTSTVDYSWRPFQKRVDAARAALRRDMDARAALSEGNWELYREHEAHGLADTTLTSFDYTDTYIRKQGVTREGRKYRVVKYPNKDMSLKRYPEGMPFTERDERGYMKKLSGPLEAWATYPMDKSRLEQGIRTGSTDEASWLSEQRNVVDTADGGVYPNPVVDRAAFDGSQYLTKFDKCNDAYKRKYNEYLLDYSPSVLYRCDDPCVLGVDFASSNDLSAFVVIRLGPMAEGEFNELTEHGKTPYCNVVWAEQHRGTSAADVAGKIYDLMKRYNLVYFHEAHEEDMWKVCRGIGLDLRGGGTGVRDELLRLNQEVLGSEEFRIYDPRDKDERVQAFSNQPGALPMLDGITAQDTTNSALVNYTLGQMQNDLLYLPKWVPESMRQDRPEIAFGYSGTKALSSQLRKLRQQPTKQARTFYMEGDLNKVENKKDLWAAFIYAAKQVRAHLIRFNNIQSAPPPMGARITKVGGKQGFLGRTPGSKPF